MNNLLSLSIKILLYILGVVVFFIGNSCKKNKIENPPDLGYDFAPTAIGTYVVYDIDSTYYDDFSHDTLNFKYRIKEKFEENYTDNQGRNAVKIVRYIKKYNPLLSYDNISWTIKDVWSCNITKTTYEVVEENVRIVKLSFPVKTDANWNGNAQNTNEEWNYKYNYTDNSEIVNGTSFEKVLLVEQKDDKLKNVIHRQYYIEKYAKNIGLIYREIKDLYSNTVISNIPVEQRIEKGIIYKQTYITHGTE